MQSSINRIGLFCNVIHYPTLSVCACLCVCVREREREIHYPLWVCVCVREREREVLPAAGVMHTSPVIMPCTAPMTEGFPKKRRSRRSHISKLVAAQTCVFRTARDASTLATYGSPPLKPVQPIQSSPAPASIRIMLFGGNLSLSLVSLGPTCNIEI